MLISPISIHTIDAVAGRVTLQLDRERIRKSPDISADEPVSRQKEAAFHGYYGYGPYWDGPGVWGPALCPRELRSRPDPACGPSPPRSHSKEILICGAPGK